MELESWQGVKNEEIQFQNFVMEGNLCIYDKEVQVFHEGEYSVKYFKIDFN